MVDVLCIISTICNACWWLSTNQSQWFLLYHWEPNDLPQCSKGLLLQESFCACPHHLSKGQLQKYTSRLQLTAQAIILLHQVKQDQFYREYCGTMADLAWLGDRKPHEWNLVQDYNIYTAWVWCIGLQAIFKMLANSKILREWEVQRLASTSTHKNHSGI